VTRPRPAVGYSSWDVTLKTGRRVVLCCSRPHEPNPIRTGHYARRKLFGCQPFVAKTRCSLIDGGPTRPETEQRASCRIANNAALLCTLDYYWRATKLRTQSASGPSAFSRYHGLVCLNRVKMSRYDELSGRFVSQRQSV
jgi:hypothetical protein